MVHNFYQIGGGEDTVFRNEVQLLRDHGVEVTTYTKDNMSLKKSRLQLLLMPFTTLWSISTYRDVKRLIRENNIQVVHCHNTFPLISPSVYYAAWKCGVPVVQTIHNFRFVCPCGTLFRDGHICEECLQGSLKPAEKYGCYRNSKLQTAVVTAMLRLHRKLGTYRKLNYIFLTDFNKDKIAAQLAPKGKLFVKPNFVYAPERVSEVSVNKNRFIFVGRLDAYKGTRFVLETFQKHPEWELYAFGIGDLQQWAEAAAQKCTNIHLMGFCPQEKIWGIWQSSCALIFASEGYEGFPMTIAESFSLGVPVLTTRLGNQGSIVKASVTGELFALHNSTEFEQGIHMIQTHREHYADGLQNAAAQYAPQVNFVQLMRIYEQLAY